MQGDFNAIPDDDEGGVCDVQMRIDAEGNRKKSVIAGRLGIAVEEITVVEVAVGTRKSDRLGGLMDRIIVRLAQHGLPLLVWLAFSPVSGSPYGGNHARLNRREDDWRTIRNPRSGCFLVESLCCKFGSPLPVLRGEVDREAIG